MINKTPAAVLFDLDGTLFDTAGDIGAALNLTMAEYGQAPFGNDVVRHMIGRGAPILIERATAAKAMKVDEAVRAQMLERFFHHYEAIEEGDQSTATAYPGAEVVVRQVHAAGIRTAVVTNKQHRFAVALLERLQVAPSIDLVVGGDTCARRKPDPMPLQFACESLKVSPSNAVMVGDSVNDVEAARGAGIPVICMTYGYNEGKDPRQLPANAWLDTLLDLPGLLRMPTS